MPHVPMPPVKPPREPGTGPRCHLDRAKLEAAFERVIGEYPAHDSESRTIRVLLRDIRRVLLEALS